MEQLFNPIYMFMLYGAALTVPIIVMTICVIVSAKMILREYFRLKTKYHKETHADSVSH